jgi:hypothetical protein
MRIGRSCSWCHTMNYQDVQYCRSCGHDAWKTRMECECSYCLGLVRQSMERVIRQTLRDLQKGGGE